MGKKKKKTRSDKYVIFVDYENAPDCLPLVEDFDFEQVWIFVGRQQKKIPLDLVQQMQRLGRAVQWVSPGAVGKNALDFILAMHVGIHHARAEKGVAFAILSADKGYDPLIGELAREGRKVVRVNPDQALAPARRAKKTTKKAKTAKKKAGRTTRTTAPRATLSALVDRVADRLDRMSEERLPTREKTLLKHVESQLPETDKKRAAAVVEALKRRKVITVAARSGTVRYLGG